MIFMFLAGTSQVIYYNLAKLNFRKVIHNEEFWFYLLTVITTGTLAVILLFANTSKHFEEAFREGFFQIVSIITCTGFATADYNLWPLAGITLIFLLMFSGGSTGSTSGGIKLARHLVLLKNINRVLVQQNHPNAIVSVRMNGKVIDERTNFSIISFVILYILVFAVGTVILLISGSDLVVSASSVATCMAGIGPGMGFCWTHGQLCRYSRNQQSSIKCGNDNWQVGDNYRVRPLFSVVLEIIIVNSGLFYSIVQSLLGRIVLRSSLIPTETYQWSFQNDGYFLRFASPCKRRNNSHHPVFDIL